MKKRPVKSTKKEVSNEEIFDVVVFLRDKIVGIENKVEGVDDTIMGIEEKIDDIEKRMSTKAETRNLEKRTAYIESSMATKADLVHVATKDNLENSKEEILVAIKPVERAVDKDAVTLLNHEKRITRLEKQLV